MPSDFRKIHAKAERTSLWLTFLFGLGLVLSTAIYTLACYLLLQFFFHGILDSFAPRHTLNISLTFGALLAFITLINYLDAKHAYREQPVETLAKRLGAQPLRVTMFKEDQKLHNIVTEMAIAARIPAPKILVARAEESINAFVLAGRDDEVALVVSLGALKYLTRAELQALIAHEFGHIINEDVFINRHLSAILHGYYTVSSWRHGGRLALSAAREKVIHFSLIQNENGDPNLLGIVLGYTGFLLYLYGRIVQAAYSRSRERMADARAVQYTRNASALIGTLKKSLALQHLAISRYHIAPEYAHVLFLNDALQKILATHPSTEERIRAFGGVILPHELQTLANKLQRNPFELNTQPDFPTTYWYD
ncbi:MAG: M48 family metalloprotease [Cardiobacteriaceae bacterium]|nr:M48 family metalloprotease [Cardiobacteriaceae bacterium]